MNQLRTLKRPISLVFASKPCKKYASPCKVVINDGSSHHSYQKRPTLTHGATPSRHQTHQITHAQPKQGGHDRPRRPPAVSGGTGSVPAPEAPDPAPARTGCALKPCRGRRSRAPPGALESPRRGPGSRVARGLLQPPSTGSSGPVHAASAEQPAPQAKHCSFSQPAHHCHTTCQPIASPVRQRCRDQIKMAPLI